MFLLTTLFYFLVFLPLVFLVFYSLGFWLIERRYGVLYPHEVISLSFCLGLVLFLLLAVAFGVLHIRSFVLPVVILSDVLLLLKFKRKVFAPWKVFLQDKPLLLIIIVGIFIQGIINFPSGFLYKEGLYFWSSQGHDGIWHIALMEEVKKVFPPQNPLFFGESLYNYHYLIDITMGEFGRIFPFFSSLDLYFRFFPVMLSFMIGMAVFSFVSRWQANSRIGYLAMFFTYFVGSFGYVVNYLHGGGIFGGETAFWAAQGNTILGNPPIAASYSLVPAFFLCFSLFVKTREKFWLATSFLIASVLAGFKVSGGLVILVGLGFATLVDLLFHRRLSVLLLTGLLGLSNFLTFKTMTRGAASFLMFLPWWFVRTMVVAGNRLNWVDLENQRQHYLSKGTWHAYLRVAQVELTAFLIFLVGNLGMRVIGFAEIIRRFAQGRKVIYKDPLEVALFVTMVTGFVVLMLFVQRGIIYNNIQFMQYFLLIFGFYAAIAVYKLLSALKNQGAKILVGLMMFALSVPTVVGNIVEFYGPNAGPLSKVTNAQLEALDYLKEHTSPDDVILNIPFNKYLQDKFKYQPKPIYAWYSTAYIPALASRRTYLSSEEQVLIMDYPVEERRANMIRFFQQDNFSWNRQFLKDSGINFIYVSKDEIEKPLNMSNNGIEKFFENSEVIIYKVFKDKSYDFQEVGSKSEI